MSATNSDQGKSLPSATATPTAAPSGKVPFVDLGIQYRSLQKEIDAAVLGTLAKGDFINGEHCKAFEKELAASMGTQFAVGVSSCTAAITLVLKACGIGPGDEVITTVHTAMPTAEGITATGAEVRFVDIQKDSHLVDPMEIEKAVNPRTKAVVPVHLYGTPCDMDAILDIARRHNLVVIEDCAQAQGAEYKGRKVGTIGRAGVYSFFPSKNLGAAGDAGAMCTNDAEVARVVKMMSNHGRQEKFTHEIEGGNHRLDTLQAGILRVKLPHLPAWNENRRKAARLYNELLKGCPGVGLPFDPSYAQSVWHLYTVQVDNPEGVSAELKKRGIGTGFHYPLALNLQPAYSRFGLGPGSMPNAERFCSRTLSLPMFGDITEDQVRRSAETLREVMSGRS